MNEDKNRLLVFLLSWRSKQDIALPGGLVRELTDALMEFNQKAGTDGV